MAAIIASYGGNIVGKIECVNEYQVQLSKVVSYNELTEIVDELEENPAIDRARVNLVIYMEPTTYYPNDREWKLNWSNEPGGKKLGCRSD